MKMSKIELTRLKIKVLFKKFEDVEPSKNLLESRQFVEMLEEMECLEELQRELTP